MAERERALILAPFSDEGLRELQALVDVEYESWLDTRRLHDPEELGQRLHEGGFSILIIESDFVFEETFDAAPGLKLIGICRAATSHVDLETATLRGVPVVHAPGRNARAVAEHVLGLLLGLARHIPHAHAYTRTGQWNDPVEPYTRFRGVELSGKTLGIVGLGAIGRVLVQLTQGFGMRILAHDPYVTDAPSGVSLTELDGLLATSDFIVTLAPPSPSTAGLLDTRRLALVKPTSFLVTASGAGIAVQDALVHALRERRIAGAAIDVFDTHPVAPDSPFLTLDNVVLTPHIGGATNETVARHSAMMVEEVRRHLAGERPVHLANPDVWKRDA
ncbi:MAG: hypothetical protein FJ317_07200 [SAR202 cluster bacterium]|nr:hypothetical protein [SAR202 cluster bacterium]